MAVSANRLELLQIADAVAREKAIDRGIVIAAMEDAIAKAIPRTSTSIRTAQPGCASASRTRPSRSVRARPAGRSARRDRAAARNRSSAWSRRRS